MSQMEKSAVVANSFKKHDGGLLVSDRFILGKKLGSGSFGEIYIGIHKETKKQYALKLESVKTRHPQLIYEARVLKLLGNNLQGIPTIKYAGIDGNFRVLAMDLLGKNLEELFSYCGRRFSMKTICMLGDQMIARLQYIHQKHFLHRDIKPDNFLIGIGEEKSLVYLIDFGLAKKYRDPRTLCPIPERTGKSLVGTARYASVHAHLGWGNYSYSYLILQNNLQEMTWNPWHMFLFILQRVHCRGKV
jgi:serine/threonine protein kinase